MLSVVLINDDKKKAFCLISSGKKKTLAKLTRNSQRNSEDSFCKMSTETTPLIKPERTPGDPCTIQWLPTAQRIFGCVASILFFGLLAVYARTIFSATGSPINFFEYGWLHAMLVFVVNFIFGQYTTSYLSFHALLATWLAYCPRVKNDSAFNSGVWVPYLLIAIFQAGAWFLVAVIAFGVFPEPPFNRDLTSPVPFANTTGLEQFRVFLFETLGKMLIDAVWVYSLHFKGGSTPWRFAAHGVAYGAAVAVLGPLTGGSVNFWRSFAVHVVEGTLTTTMAVWQEIASEFAAPFLIVLVFVFLYRRPMKAKAN